MRWVDLKGYEGRYKVSENGDLKSIKNNCEKILKWSISNKGYVQYTLSCMARKSRNTYTGQQLVAIAFLNHNPKSTSGYVIDHINDNKLDNRLKNLRLISNHQNSIKRYHKNQLFGVTKLKNGKWRSSVWHNKKNIYLGCFNDELTAHLNTIDYMHKNNIKRLVEWVQRIMATLACIAK